MLTIFGPVDAGPVAATSLPATRVAAPAANPAAAAPAPILATVPAVAPAANLQSLAVRAVPNGAAPVLNGVAFGAGW